jgi:hypothetical protein
VRIAIVVGGNLRVESGPVAGSGISVGIRRIGFFSVAANDVATEIIDDETDSFFYVNSVSLHIRAQSWAGMAWRLLAASIPYGQTLKPSTISEESISEYNAASYSPARKNCWTGFSGPDLHTALADARGPFRQSQEGNSI